MDKKNVSKVFVLDTNVLLYDPQAIYKFGDNLIVIPMIVIEELDNFKKNQDETGRNSRQFSRYLDDLRKKGDLSQGVSLERGGILRVDTNGKIEGTRVETELVFSKPDHRILSTALHESKKHPDKKVILVSKDINLRIKSDILGVPSEDYENEKINFEEMYSGLRILDVANELVTEFKSKEELPINCLDIPTVYPNQYFFLKGTDSNKVITRFDIRRERLVPISKEVNLGTCGIFPKNLEQTIALDLLLNNDIKLVSLVGKAGTGKTLLSIVAGIKKTVEREDYKRMLVSRPIFPMGKDLGYLPGDINEKLNPWMKPIFDNIDFVMSGSTRFGSDITSYNDLMDQDLITLEPLTYIRGRSIPKQYILIDESQNTTPHEIKTIISRAGNDTKIILTGDCHQIDNPYVDSSSNGLSYVVERVKKEAITGHITLIKGERSELAEIASNLL